MEQLATGGWRTGLGCASHIVFGLLLEHVALAPQPTVTITVQNVTL